MEPITNGLFLNDGGISKGKALFQTSKRNQIGSTFFGMITKTIAWFKKSQNKVSRKDWGLSESNKEIKNLASFSAYFVHLSWL